MESLTEIKKRKLKEQNIRNGLPLADYYAKAQSSTEMCNSQYMPIQKIKKGKINIKALVRIHKLNASCFAFADGNNLPCTELLHIPLVSPPEYQMPYTGHMLAQDSPL